MLEHSKTVLRGVREDDYLVRKELMKPLSWLDKEEVLELKIWVKKHFNKSHKTTIDELFLSY